MIRFLGLLLVAASTLGSGAVYAAALAAELRQWEGFLKLARHIRTRIEGFHQPLDGIYASFRDDTLEACGFLPLLRRQGLAEALTSCRSRLTLRPALIALLTDFSEPLGKSHTDDQLRHCDRCLVGMEEALQTLRREHPEKLRLARTLSLSLAAMVTLLLW